MTSDVEKLKKIFYFCEKDESSKSLCKKLQNAIKIKNRKEYKQASRSEKISAKMKSAEEHSSIFGEYLSYVKEAQGAGGCPFGTFVEWNNDFRSGKIRMCPARSDEDETSGSVSDIDFDDDTSQPDYSNFQGRAQYVDYK